MSFQFCLLAVLSPIFHQNSNYFRSPKEASDEFNILLPCWNYAIQYSIMLYSIAECSTMKSGSEICSIGYSIAG